MLLFFFVVVIDKFEFSRAFTPSPCNVNKNNVGLVCPLSGRNFVFTSLIFCLAEDNEKVLSFLCSEKLEKRKCD